MKKTILIVAIALFTINASAQEKKTASKAETKTEACCMAKEYDAKTMTADEIEKCKVKCKAEGKECKMAMLEKASDSKTKSPEDVAKCKSDGKNEKKCCAKKA